MSFSNDEKDVSKLLVDKYWEFYRITDDRRIKSFYYLISIVFVAILLTSNSDLNDITFLDMVMKRAPALYIFPLMIFILSLRYFFLSALSLDNHYKFSKYFEGFKNKAGSLSIHDSKYTINSFNADDVNELPNMFLFPIHLDNSGYIYSVLREPLKRLISIVFFLLHVVAIITFIYFLIITKDDILETYLLILIMSLFVTLVYFFFKTIHVRKYFDEIQLEFRAIRREKMSDNVELNKIKDEETKRRKKMTKKMEFMEKRAGRIISWIIVALFLIILIYFAYPYFVNFI